MSALPVVSQFIRAAKISFMDRIDHPNWEYTRSIQMKLRKAKFRLLQLEPEAIAVQRRVKQRWGTDMAFYVRETSRELSCINMVWGSADRDQSSILVTYASGFNDNNGAHSRRETTFYHYMQGHASAAKLADLIGAPDAKNSLRSSIILENPEVPTRPSLESDIFFDTQIMPLINKFRL